MKKPELPPHMPEIFGEDSRYKKERDPAWRDSTREDRKWLHTIPCKTGGESAHLYIHGTERVGYWGEGATTRRKLLAIPGVTAHQTGDVEFTVVFHKSVFPKVAKVVRPRYRKTASPAQLAALAASRQVAASSKTPASEALLGSNSHEVAANVRESVSG